MVRGPAATAIQRPVQASWCCRVCLLIKLYFRTSSLVIIMNQLEIDLLILITNNNDNMYTFPVQGLGVYLGHLMISLCSGFPIFAQ
jgi:hypothetical protein